MPPSPSESQAGEAEPAVSVGEDQDRNGGKVREEQQNDQPRVAEQAVNTVAAQGE